MAAPTQLQREENPCQPGARIDEVLMPNRPKDAFQSLCGARLVQLLQVQEILRPSCCSRMLVAYDGVVHPILAAEVADSAIAGVDTDPQLEGFFQTDIPPLELKLAHPPLHRDGHIHARDGVLLHTLCLRVAEERQDRVADVLVDGRAMIEG